MARLSQCDKILNTIRMNGSMTSREMIDQGIFKYSSRIADLRKKGYDIRAHRVKDTLYTYTLGRAPETKRAMTADEANNFLKTLPAEPANRIIQEAIL